MSQILIILWTPPTPPPAQGYEVAYRANGFPSYMFANTSGMTSGVNSVIVSGLAPACYEGYVQSECSGESNFSLPVSWGINSQLALTWILQRNFFTNQSVLFFTSAYGNPYNTLVSGTYVVNGSPSPFSFTYPAGAVNFAEVLTSGSTVTSVTVTSVSPAFDNGGSLQQFDSVNTPQYFQFYATSGMTSGVTWTGSPITLPSFVLMGFNVTSVDGSGNPLSGNLLVQWIQSVVYGGGIGIYSHVTFNVYDPDTSIMGTVTVPYGVPGLNMASIPMTKVAANLNTSTQFTMTTLWADTSLSATQVFYLPNF
jgi:hypothetical protein